MDESGALDRSGRLAQFHNEVRTARQVSHPNVCRVYDIGELDGQLFITMEYVDGEDLAALLRRIGRLPEDKGVEMLERMPMAFTSSSLLASSTWATLVILLGIAVFGFRLATRPGSSRTALG